MRRFFILLLLVLIQSASAKDNFGPSKTLSELSRRTIKNAKTVAIFVVSPDPTEVESVSYVVKSYFESWKRFEVKPTNNDELLKPAADSDLIAIVKIEPANYGYRGVSHSTKKVSVSVYHGPVFRLNPGASLANPPLWTYTRYGDSRATDVLSTFRKDTEKL